MKTKRGTPSIEALLKHLADESQPLSVARLYALSNLERDDLAHVQTAWPDLPADRRRAAVRHLADITETNFEVDFSPIFRLGLKDPDPGVREAAIDGLWEVEDPALIAPLVKIMQEDTSEAVRAVAAGTLGHFVYLDELEDIPHAQVVPALQALRKIIATPDDSLEVRRRAVEAIAYSSADDVPDIVRAAYASPDELMRVSAIYAMGNSADDRWIETVIEELEAQSPAIRYEAARAAGELEARNAVSTLARLLDDPDREVQEMTVWALGQIGGNQARKLMTQLAKSNDEALAEAATEALEEMEWMHGATRDMPLFVFDPHADEDDEDDA
jgi:HEAT repeat protein